MSGIRVLAALTVVGCAFVVAGSAGADEPGPPGGKEPPQAPVTVGAAGPPGYVVVASGFVPVPGSALEHASVSCPAGTVVFGGGVNFSSDSLAVNVNSSYPLGTQGWQGWVSNATGAATSFKVSAVCAKQPAGYQVVKKTFPNPGLSQTGGAVACPATALVLAGGGYSSSRDLFVNMNGTYPFYGDRYGWVTEMNNGSSSYATVATYAICAKKPGPAGLAYFGALTPNPDGSQSLGEVDCGAHSGRVPIGGGVRSYSKSLDVNVNSSYPVGSAWRVYENNSSGGDSLVAVSAVCVS